MALPFFYINPTGTAASIIELDEDNSRHVIQVLRMKAGEQMNLTDGLGHIYTAAIVDDHKKHCRVSVIEKKFVERKAPFVTVAISLLKNASRFEWFLEKATEIGVERIIPLLCERTEKQRSRMDRMKNICISAMLQSQQCWLPDLWEPVKFENISEWKSANGINMIAHCEDDNKSTVAAQPLNLSTPQLITIGPEGDFTTNEIQLAIGFGFIPVSLGDTRLRTETAGMVAATLLRIKA